MTVRSVAQANLDLVCIAHMEVKLPTMRIRATQRGVEIRRGMLPLGQVAIVMGVIVANPYTFRLLVDQLNAEAKRGLG